MAGQGIQDDREREGRARHGDDVVGHRVEAVLAFVGDHHHAGGVRLEDGGILDDVFQHDLGRTCRHHQDERFARKIDVLLVLDDVRADGLVAQFRKLDAHLVTGHLVGAAADHGPVALLAHDLVGAALDLLALGDHAQHQPGHALKVGEFRGDALVCDRAGQLGQIERQHVAGRDLGIEGLGRGHRHLDVAAVTGVINTVRFGGDVGLAAVDDRDHVGAALARHGHGAVGVGRGAGLGHGDHERVAQILGQAEAREVGGRLGDHVQVGLIEIDAQGLGDGRASHKGRALTDHVDAPEAAVLDGLAGLLGQHVVAQVELDLAICKRVLAPEGLLDRGRRVQDLLDQVVAEAGAVDVAGRDLGLLQARGLELERRAVVPLAAEALKATLTAVEHHQLAASRLVACHAFKLAVQLDEAAGLLDQTVDLGSVGVLAGGQSDVERLAAAALG
ncbi:MAG: hypothetical protein BWY87_00697 [Deltaproteobacteria bacterium ADurb.Bin510]|nr:MAG: hypothetical protein BWY87_00697 [Deltaproteobacteria bacterium ADurb.Bin510]